MLTWMIRVWLFILFLHSAICIDWDSDIIATEDEFHRAHHDPLYTYFGKQVENVTFFHSREAMQKIVGEFKDVEPARFVSHISLLICFEKFEDDVMQTVYGHHL